MKTAAPLSESAGRQGALWGARPQDWAEQEVQQAPVYEEAIRRIPIATGQRVLEVGCGSGVFLQAAAGTGAQVAGIDAAAPLVDIAHSRVPGADVRVGDLQALPWDDDTFDAVLGFNSFQFAESLPDALAEAGRVAKPGAPVVAQVWGRPDHCDLAAMLRAIGPLRPERPAGASPSLSGPGVLESIAADAGLRPRETFDVEAALDYPDAETMVRLMLSAAGAIEAVEHSGEAPVRDAILHALEGFRTAAGGYRLSNEWHFVVAEA